jgi:dihydroorotase-like cyclic amidohydrolase
VKDGRVDIVASDHAPHARDEKYRPDGDYSRVPAGLPGLETFLSVILHAFGEHAPKVLAESCAAQPARRFGLGDRGRLEVGKRADIAIVDTQAKWTVSENGRFSRGACIPFSGESLPGVVRYTILAGRVVFEGGKPAEEPVGVWVRRAGPE